MENMTYLGVRIYRFYIKCPGCLAEISFRTDPESTDYVIEAGAHRNFQALKLAEEQAAREEREAKEEIESNPMLLLENRTQQSQYEMEVLESLEDLREMNDRHAGIDLGKIAEKFESERRMTREQIGEAERLAALRALGYEMVEGLIVKRIAPEEVDSETPLKKIKKCEDSKASNISTNSNTVGNKTKKNNIKSRLSGIIKTKVPQEAKASTASSQDKLKHDSSQVSTSEKSAEEKIGLLNKPEKLSLAEKCTSAVLSGGASVGIPMVKSGSTGLSGLSFLGVYSDSESDESET